MSRRALRGFAPSPLRCGELRVQDQPLPGQAQPRRPLGRHDAHDVGVVPEAGYAPLLDGHKPELHGFPDGVAHRGLRHAHDGREVPDSKAAVLPAHRLSGHQREDRLLGQREPSR